MELALRGLGDSSSSWCDPTDPFWCVICGNCIATSAAGSVTGTNPLPTPATIAPPTIDSDPNSPTYGQALINGVAVGTPAQAQALINQQIAANAATNTAAAVAAAGAQANANALTSSCNPFQTANLLTGVCSFSVTAPGTILAIGGLLLALAFMKK